MQIYSIFVPRVPEVCSLVQPASLSSEATTARCNAPRKNKPLVTGYKLDIALNRFQPWGTKASI